MPGEPLSERAGALSGAIRTATYAPALTMAAMQGLPAIGGLAKLGPLGWKDMMFGATSGLGKGLIGGVDVASAGISKGLAGLPIQTRMYIHR